jgi:NTE family protein
VIESSVLIMQERIKRVNLAVEPPDVLVQPQLGDLKMLDYDQVERTIAEGAARVREKVDEIKELLQGPSEADRGAD